MPKKRGPTNRQRLLVKGLAKGKTQKQAAIDAGYSPKNADQGGHQAVQVLQKTAPELLAAHGLDDNALIGKYLAPLMKADRSTFTQFEGKFTDERKRPDWDARKSGLDIALKIRGMYAKEEVNGPSFTVVVVDSTNRPNWNAMRKAPALETAPGGD